jgi:hypothetical protein
MCYYDFLGGHKMTNAELTRVVDTQKEKIGYLTNRIGYLTDELAVLKGEIDTFKNQVANDMRRVVKTLQTKG